MATASGSGELISVFTQSLDDAVAEVFRLMMGMRCDPIDQCPEEEREMISAVIGLAGAMSGICVLCGGQRIAMRMAEIFAGVSLQSANDTIKDAVGEVCNMVAGAWKAKLPSLASQCMLSTPTVITGTNYSLHYQRPDFRIERFYRFEDLSFTVILLCESLQ